MVTEVKLHAGQYRMQRIKISKEYFPDETFINEHLIDFQKEDGLDLYFYTIIDDDHKRGLITLTMFSSGHKINSILATTPSDYINETINWVYDNNPHLVFDRTSKPDIGYNADDFVHNRLTAILPFAKIPIPEELEESWKKFFNRSADGRINIKKQT